MTQPMNNDIGLPEPSRPIDWVGKLQDILFSKKCEVIFKEYMNRIIRNNFEIPEFRIKLIDIQDDSLIDLFLNDFDKFYDFFQEALLNRILFETEIKEHLEEERKRLKPEELHVIIDIEDIELKNREIKDFSSELSQ